jgi:apolipoprotein D and lipocalin family protein
MGTDVGVRIACLDLVSGCYGEPLEVVDVDLGRFQGRWYELARLSGVCSRARTGSTVRELRAKGPMLDTAARSPHESDSTLRVISAVTVPDVHTPAKLRVHSGDFSGDGWVIDLDPDYRYAVLGHPTRKLLWIVSRLPTIDRKTLSAILERAKHKGFDVSQLDFANERLGRSAA